MYINTCQTLMLFLLSLSLGIILVEAPGSYLIKHLLAII